MLYVRSSILTFAFLPLPLFPTMRTLYVSDFCGNCVARIYIPNGPNALTESNIRNICKTHISCIHVSCQLFKCSPKNACLVHHLPHCFRDPDPPGYRWSGGCTLWFQWRISVAVMVKIHGGPEMLLDPFA